MKSKFFSLLWLGASAATVIAALSIGLPSPAHALSSSLPGAACRGEFPADENLIRILGKQIENMSTTNYISVVCPIVNNLGAGSINANTITFIVQGQGLAAGTDLFLFSYAGDGRLLAMDTLRHVPGPQFSVQMHLPTSALRNLSYLVLGAAIAPEGFLTGVQYCDCQ